MNPKFLSVFTLTIIVSLVLLNGCDLPDDSTPTGCDNKTINHGLTTDQKGQIPYKEFDTINLISNSGDTIHCISKGIQLFNTRDFIKHSNPACGPNGTENLHEANKFEFVDSLKGNNIEIINYRFYPDEPYRQLSIVSISFKNKEFFFQNSHISDSRAYNYIGNIEIRGNQYMGVNKAESPRGDSTCFLLYNKVNGIIKIQLNANDIWELLDN